MQVVPQLRLYTRLWCLGLWESLQLQKCVVLLTLDDTKSIWHKVLQCSILNGGIFLGSQLWWQYILQPTITLGLSYTLTPLAGAQASSTFELVLAALFQVAWLLPAYLITLLISCGWYNDIAAQAVQVHARHAARLLAAQKAGQPLSTVLNRPDHPSQLTNGTNTAAAPTPAPAHSSASFSASQPLDIAAQEVYRVVMFLVVYAEVWALGQVPWIGGFLYLLTSCWLSAFYCYDYQWGLHGAKLPDRIAFFESSAPFFAGFGTLLALVGWLLPFYVGAAVVAVLYPVFVLVACDSDPVSIVLEEGHKYTRAIIPAAQAGIEPGSCRGPAGASLKKVEGLVRVPVFSMALLPTDWIFTLACRR